MRGGQAHHSSTMVLSLLMAIIGVALIVENIGIGASILSPRMLMGVLFIAAGGGRLYVELRRGRT